MRDFIYINYGLFVDKIYNNYFFINDEKIYIYKINNIEELKELFNLTNKMYYNKIPVSTFLLNKKNEYYSVKENKYIVLLKVNDREKEITYKYLENFFDINTNLKEINLVEKWKEEIDRLELKIVKLNNEYELIQNSINYFIGCAENAISLLSECEYKITNDISHNLLYSQYCKENINNPLYFVKINKMYDISRYIIYNFYNDNLDYEELYKILKKIDNELEENILFASLLYNDYYFELVSKILNEEIEEKNIIKINQYVKNYEELLSFCKNNMNKSEKIKLINWF